jgi:hypothetical protein
LLFIWLTTPASVGFKFEKWLICFDIARLFSVLLACIIIVVLPTIHQEQLSVRYHISGLCGA